MLYVTDAKRLMSWLLQPFFHTFISSDPSFVPPSSFQDRKKDRTKAPAICQAHSLMFES